MKKIFTIGILGLLMSTTLLAQPRSYPQATPAKPAPQSSASASHPNNGHQNSSQNWSHNNHSGNHNGSWNGNGHNKGKGHNHWNGHGSNYYHNHPVTIVQPRPVIQVNVPAPRPIYGYNDYNARSFNFRDFMYTLKNQRFESDRLSVARQALYNNYFDTYQIREVLSVLEYEDSRIEFAKQAYLNCVDKQNYYRVNDMFKFSSSVHQLEEYIYARR